MRIGIFCCIFAKKLRKNRNMTLKGKFEHSRGIIKCVQWIVCVLLFTMPAMISVVAFPQPLSVTSLKWIQFLQTTSIFLLPPLCMAYLWSEQPLDWLRMKGERSLVKGEGLWAVVLMLVALPAINLLGYLNQQMTLPTFLEPLEQWMKTSEENAKVLTEQFLNVTTFSGLIINLLLMALLPAVAEELTFRGVLMNLFELKGERLKVKDKRTHLAIWCSAILFSAIHLQFYGFVPRMLMGALFGYMLVWTGSLWIPILMHFTNNAMAVLLYFVAYRAGWNMEQVDAIGTNDTLWLGVVSMVLTIVGIYAFRRSTTMSNASSRISSGN